jgi:hypothetical protein
MLCDFLERAEFKVRGEGGSVRMRGEMLRVGEERGVETGEPKGGERESP